MKTCSRKNTAIAFALLCISFCVSSASAVTVQPGPTQRSSELNAHPTIQVKEPEYNFGEVQEGSEVEHQFTVGNPGNTALNIERVRVD